ncbi:MAG TPA: DNA gyrase subunit A [Vitreimonas sp.]|uniref:DNA gyrase subunit A n=1 Tax=Vitreimonas sp. TaxID=3069702 RepID=UPI002D737FFB|nr:DNA gyrase subunit A [Vitreimonas sp.]HYD88496.1 DNA gyrase subunit A [Vitreimonas sp.]
MSDTSDPAENGGPTLPKGVSLITIEDELKRSYLDYAMSVIVSRALPDVRDGLKPVHRRILFGMDEAGNTHDKGYRKSANTVGEVMGRYHPHGDQAIYFSLVRMAQEFAMSLPLIDGQGNFGSIDGDMPAAMRYTESRLAKSARALLDDIDEDTVDFVDNYDGSRKEPAALPAKYPNLLVNGAGGIAVGMATNIPPHNLSEVVDAAVAMIDNPEIADLDLLDIVPGPDFPTGGEILGRSGARAGLLTGRGSVTIRARHHNETIRGREALVFTEIPYQVNKAEMVDRIGEQVREKRIEGIAEIRDESNRLGIRLVIELKRDAVPDVVLNQLYRYSQLQTSFGVNMLALHNGKPEQMGLRQMLSAFLSFREQVITRRTKFRLAKARKRGHETVGLAIAVANIDDVIRLIRESPDPTTARERLVARDWPAGDMMPLIALIADPRTIVADGDKIRLSEEQARAILALQLSRLTGLGRDDIAKAANEIAEEIKELLSILGSRERILAMIRGELIGVKEAFGVPRRTAFSEAEGDIDDEALIPREDMVITVTHGGYVKRTPLAAYRTQRRGGRGRAGMAMKEEDFVTRVFVASTHAPILFFSSSGMVYKMKAWRIPAGDPRTKGRALVNLLPLGQGETITSVMALPEDERDWDKLDVMFATKSGNIRRNKLSDFVQVNRNGKIAMKLDDGDGIVGVQISTEDEDVLLTTANGMCVRFRTTDVRVFKGRDSTGVRGVDLRENDHVIGMAVLRHVDVTTEEVGAYFKWDSQARGEVETGDDETPSASSDAIVPFERLAWLKTQEQFILTATSNGLGKRASAYEYRVTNRGGKGLIAHRLTDDASVVASFPVKDDEELLLVTDKGQLIRTGVDQIRIAGRATQGVILINVGEDEHVVAAERLEALGGENGDGAEGEADGK